MFAVVLIAVLCEKTETSPGGHRPRGGCLEREEPFHQWGWAKRGLVVDGAQSRPHEGTSGQRRPEPTTSRSWTPSLQASTAGPHPATCCPQETLLGMTIRPAHPSALLRAFDLLLGTSGLCPDAAAGAATLSPHPSPCPPSPSLSQDKDRRPAMRAQHESGQGGQATSRAPSCEEGTRAQRRGLTGRQ